MGQLSWEQEMFAEKAEAARKSEPKKKSDKQPDRIFGLLIGTNLFSLSTSSNAF
jgi:hypothetical protein